MEAHVETINSEVNNPHTKSHDLKLFKSSRSRLEQVGIRPLQPFQNANSITTHLKRALPICFLALTVISTNAFLLFKATTVGEYTFSFYISTSTVADLFLFGIFKSNPIFKLIDNLQVFIQKRMVNPESKLLYESLNEKIEKWSDMFYLLFVKVSVPALLIINFTVSFYLYFTTDFGGDAFRLPYPFWMPFDWRTPFGYLFAFSFEMAFTLYICHTAACHLVFLFGSCFIMITFADELKGEFDSLNKSNKSVENLEVIIEEPEHELPEEGEKYSKKEANELPKKELKERPEKEIPNREPEKKIKGISAKTAEKTTERYKRFIEFHIEMIDLGREFSNSFQPMTFVLSIWGLLTGCSSLLMIEIKMLHFMENPADLIQPLIFGFWSFAFIFLLCEFGERVTDRFDALNDNIYQSDWYTFSPGIQRMLPTVILAAQQPVSIHIFGSVRCSRETFRAVVNAAYSNFMILREFIK